MSLAAQRFLRPSRLPFRHFGTRTNAPQTLAAALRTRMLSGAEDEGRTRDLLLGKEALYH